MSTEYLNSHSTCQNIRDVGVVVIDLTVDLECISRQNAQCREIREEWPLAANNERPIFAITISPDLYRHFAFPAIFHNFFFLS